MRWDVQGGLFFSMNYPDKRISFRSHIYKDEVVKGKVNKYRENLNERCDRTITDTFSHAGTINIFVWIVTKLENCRHAYPRE